MGSLLLNQVVSFHNRTLKKLNEFLIDISNSRLFLEALYWSQILEGLSVELTEQHGTS